MKNIDELIFGNILEDINEIIQLDESVAERAITNSRINASNMVKACSIKNPIARLKATTSVDTAETTLIKNVNDAKNKNPEEEKALGSGGLKEAVISSTDNRKNALTRKIEFIDSQNQKLEAQKQAFAERIDKKKEINEKNKQNVKNAIDALDGAAKLNTSEIQDKNQSLKESFDRNLMLFNGTSGDALKFFVIGEINNSNKEELSVANTMKGKPDVETIVKKISRLYKKNQKGDLSDDEYNQLKSLKLQFRVLFTQYKNRYNARFK